MGQHVNNMPKGYTECWGDKCQFAVNKVMFPGHIVSDKGIEADLGKIKAITEMPTPKDAADVKRWAWWESSLHG